jgi:hypothetical protein
LEQSNGSWGERVSAEPLSLKCFKVY